MAILKHIEVVEVESERAVLVKVFFVMFFRTKYRKTIF